MTWRNWCDTLGLLFAVTGLAPLSAGTSWAGVCNYPGDSDPLIKNCQVQALPPINFGADKTHYQTFSCTEPNSLFLGNAGGYPGVAGYDFDNSWFTVIPTSQTFDSDFNTLITNWRAEQQTLIVTLACLPGDQAQP